MSFQRESWTYIEKHFYKRHNIMIPKEFHMEYELHPLDQNSLPWQMKEAGDSPGWTRAVRKTSFFSLSGLRRSAVKREEAERRTAWRRSSRQERWDSVTQKMRSSLRLKNEMLVSFCVQFGVRGYIKSTMFLTLENPRTITWGSNVHLTSFCSFYWRITKLFGKEENN